ncbi:Probable glycosyltransferase At5g03795 [Linum grandiflorum]
MEFHLRLPKLNQIESKKWLIFVVAVAIAHLVFQPLLFPYGYNIRSLLPTSNDSMFDQSGMVATDQSSVKPGVSRNALAVDASSSTTSLKIDFISVNDNKSDSVGDISHVSEVEGHDQDTDEEDDLDDGPAELGLDRDVVDDDDNEVSLERTSILEFPSEASKDLRLYKNVTIKSSEEETSVSRAVPKRPSTIFEAPPVNPQAAHESSSVFPAVVKGASIVSRDNSARASSAVKKQMKTEMPPISITTIEEMNDLLAQNRRSSRAMRPRWSSVRDQEILAARSQIENAPELVNDQDLYAPLFRNVSQFKRSYELMERTLKVYIYKEGKKPIFHVPILKGLYASEGWFMKLMQGSKQFVVKDPQKAHLFYMPFSSRMLEYSLTGGADHFLVACHDWAPYETSHHMEHCIKALCNADVTVGFKLGTDVSLAETFIRAARNPVRGLGGKPPSQRHILAFYAGGLHGYLRPILVKHWKDKDPDMKIFGYMPASSKMNYIQHMKSSKYCICPKGFEVNSPRVVESIFYDCVPVIISDNFVPPLFEVLNWSAFSVILPEKDIPNLKQILVSIPDKRYLELQLAVRKVQKHFLWHARPVKFDLFHMTLHSIWYNRVYQIKPR